MTFVNDQFDDVTEKVVVDLGSGAGMLSIAATILEADQVIGLEIDAVSLSYPSHCSLLYAYFGLPSPNP